MSNRRSIALLATAATLAFAVMTAAYGWTGGLWTAVFVLLIGAPVLAVTHAVARHRGRLGSLPWQLGAGVSLAVGVALASVEAIALLAFVSAHAALTIGLLLAFAGTLAGYAAWLVTRRVTSDIMAVHEVVTAVGRGDRDRRIELQSDDEVGELADAVNAMTDRLTSGEVERAALERARRDLLAAISHDLRTPLNSMRLLTDALRDDLLDEEERRHSIDQLSFHVTSLDSLIEDLFELSRIEAGDVQWQFEPVSIEELAMETVEAMRPVASRARLSLETSFEYGLAPVLVNPEKVQRVLFNLLENAIHHAPPHDAIWLRARSRQEHVEVEVFDPGPGIASADRDRVFEPFFRGGPDVTRPRDGAGLGLPICRAIIKAHGGDVWVADSPVGTSVRFTMRRAPNA